MGYHGIRTEGIPRPTSEYADFPLERNAIVSTAVSAEQGEMLGVLISRSDFSGPSKLFN